MISRMQTWWESWGWNCWNHEWNSAWSGRSPQQTGFQPEKMVGMWLIIMDDYCLVWAGLPMAYEFQMGSLRLYAFTCGYQMQPLQGWSWAGHPQSPTIPLFSKNTCDFLFALWFPFSPDFFLGISLDIASWSVFALLFIHFETLRLMKIVISFNVQWFCSSLL